jgi:hypothetical protein
METKNSVQNSVHFYSCEKCDYKTAVFDDYQKHLKTRKHNGNNSVQNSVHTTDKDFDQLFVQNSDENINSSKYDSKKYTCSCGNSFKYRSGLWKHGKNCNSSAIAPTLTSAVPLLEDGKTMTELVISLVKQNQDFQKQIFDMMKDSVGTINSNNSNYSNNTTNNNNKFNLNFFLNETCKDAMNLSEFVDTLQITLADLENVGKLGYTEGISRIFTNGLKALDISKRPIHCSDVKREVVYVKNNNIWVKEIDQLQKAIKLITNKNIKLIPKWKQANPGHHLYHNKRNDDYLKIMYESMGPTDEMEEKKLYGKIITNLAKETVILK